MDLDDLISRYIDGELDSQAEAELHHRLSISPEARSALRSHTALREASRDTRILDTPAPALHAALFNRLQQEEGMAREAAAAVVPATALAPVRSEPIPSEMHAPGRRVRRRRTALWFALPMILLATFFASEFLLVDNNETRKLAQSSRPVEDHSAASQQNSVPAASSPERSAPVAGFSDAAVSLPKADAQSVPLPPSGVLAEGGAGATSSGSIVANGESAANEEVAPPPPPAAPLIARSAPSRSSFTARDESPSDSYGDDAAMGLAIHEEKDQVLADGELSAEKTAPALASIARDADRRSLTEGSPPRIMSPSMPHQDSSVPSTTMVNRSPITRTQTLNPEPRTLASGAEAQNGPDVSPSSVQQNMGGFFEQSSIGNQLSLNSNINTQRSVNLADSSSLRALVRKESVRRSPKAVKKPSLKNRARRANRSR